MRKYIFLVLFLVCFAVCGSACQHSDGRNTVSADKYFSVCTERDGRYAYSVFGTDGKAILSETSDQPVRISMVDGSIADIATDCGSGLVTHVYCDVKSGSVSQKFSYVFAYSDGEIAYIYVPKDNPIKGRKVIVQNAFDNGALYREFKFDFADVDTPITDASFSEDGKELTLTYLFGEEQTERTETVGLGE